MDIQIKPFQLEEIHRADVEELLFQLSGKERRVSLENHPGAYNIGAFDGNKLVGFAQIFILPKTTFTFGLLEDVVVDEKYRGRGIGERIILEAISLAKSKSADRINLTSRQERTEARKLFESLGFTQQETDVFRLEFKM